MPGHIDTAFSESFDDVEIARLAAIVASSQDAILGEDLQGIVRNWSFGAELLYGYAADEIVGQSISALLPPEKAGEEAAVLSTVLAEERVHRLETVRVRKDGSRVHVALSVSPIRTHDRRIVGAAHVARDITPLLNADQVLALHSSILDASDDAIVVTSVNGIIESWSRGAEALFGYTAEETLGRSVFMLVPVERSAEEREFQQRLRDRDALRNIRTFRLRKDGKQIHVLLTIAPIVDRKGQISGLVRISRDIRDQSAYEQATAQLAAIVESSEDAIVSKNLDGIVLTWNAAAERLYGYTAVEMKWRPMSILLPPDRPEEEQHILSFLRRGERVEHFETVRVRKDGKRVFVSLTISPLCNTAGQVIGASHIARDITESRRMHETQLSQKMEAMGRLAGGISHDFNNLLSVIGGYATLLQERLHLESASARMLEQILSASARAADLTKQLLVFSRPQAVELRSIDLNEVISSTHLMLQRLIGEDIKVETKLSEDLWRVQADPGQIGQVIMNLAVNARDAMPDGGAIIIQTENWTVEGNHVLGEHQIGMGPGKYVRMMFSDTGIGMDAVTRARVFEPFFTTKDVGKGTGLGLSTVYGIVKQSGGEISVYSEPGHGATFAMYLRKAENVEEAIAPLESPVLHGTETVLLVEDEVNLRALAATVLRSGGYTVLEAGSTDEALGVSKTHAGAIDLVLTDMVMPGANGLKLSTVITDLRPDVKVVYMSGYSEHTVLDTLKMDTAAFLQKPFTPVQLLRKIRDVCDG